MLRKSFCDIFYPYEKVCIDENLMLYKGRLFFKQYIPSKRNRFGIKSYTLCDCKTGYVQDLIVYEGKSTVTESAIVSSLLQPYLGQGQYLGQGHTLYTDNFYSNPALFNFLHDSYTNACGTVKKRRQGMPKMEEELEKRKACFRAAKNLLAIKWMDKKEVYMISTIHTVNFEAVSRYGGEQSVQKPICIIDYNKSMGIVNKADMVLSTMVEKYSHNATGRQSRPANNPMRLTDRHFPTFCKPKNRRWKCSCY
ncbi:piggyBac transposable element-derived protein 4-like [Vespula squamosa]|uniref:PiggyBac transposable element-derived protein 4-like n=1 Tax=Vespula squamosa TaxID=30214 RepID=A0ABD2BG81_VESSQ